MRGDFFNIFSLDALEVVKAICGKLDWALEYTTLDSLDIANSFNCAKFFFVPRKCISIARICLELV